MYSATYPRFSPGWVHLLGTLFLALLVSSAAEAAPIYSQFGGNNLASHYSVNNTCTACTGGVGVSSPSNVVDGDLSNYALVTLGLLNSSSTLRVDLNGTAQVGDRAGFLVSRDNGLTNLGVLSSVVIRTYLKAAQGAATLQETRTISLSLLNNNTLGNSRPVQMEFVANKSFNQMSIEFSSTASLNFATRVYYAYAVSTLVSPPVRGAYSTNGVYNVSGCGSPAVSNPGNAADADLTNHASFGSLVTVNCPPALQVKLDQTASAGFYAGFVIGSSGLLDAGVLSGLKISTSLNGVSAESFTGAGILELHVLPDGKAQVSFPSTMPFNEVKIERVGAVTALDNLQLYYGFGVEPRAFEPTTQVLSDNPTAASNFQVTNNGLACVNCGVINPGNAADSNVGVNAPPAVITADAALLNTVGLRLDLNGTGTAGSRAGMVVGANTLLDAAALARLTLTTYDAAGNILESSSGASLLSVNLLPDGRQEISFNTTRDFSSVELSVSAGASLFSDLNVHYAFSDNRPDSFPTIITPLPVALTAFSGEWAQGAAVLQWATASEQNSSHFVVERATQAGPEKLSAFQAVGRVAAAGTSTNHLSYELRDREAAALGATMLYYRLRQVDADGREAFSPVVALRVKQGPAPQLQAYPNPATESATIRLHVTPSEHVGDQVFIYSLTGQLVTQLSVQQAEAQLAAPLAAGLYQAVLRSAQGDVLATQRLVVAGR